MKVPLSCLRQEMFESSTIVHKHVTKTMETNSWQDLDCGWSMDCGECKECVYVIRSSD